MGQRFVFNESDWYIWTHGRLAVALLLGFLLAIPESHAQPAQANYDESRVPSYSIPSILKPENGKSAEDAAAGILSVWPGRREELFQIFAEQMYGRQPEGPFEIDCEKLESAVTRGGEVLRQQWRVTVSTDSGRRAIDLLIFTPANAEGPVACFLGLNFGGNHTVADDEEILVTQSWVRARNSGGADEHRASAQDRGRSASRWPVEQIVGAGLGVATAYYGDIDPDMDDGFENGVHALFPDFRPSQAHPDRWGSISAWAWGLSRLLDCLQQVEQVDAQRVAVIGHSRLGKTALWAGASDPRFAAVISNDSGCGGAAFSRRQYGETVARINSAFPHWFCPNFKQYGSDVSTLPIDQHQLLALIAPRLLYVASATQDRWADPLGEFMSLNLATEIYRALREAREESVEVGEPIRQVGYHLRDGRHDIDAWDWAHYIRFIDQL